MKSFFDRLNLRPNERRLVVVVAIILFVVLNIWLVWPHFKDWRMVQADHAKAKDKLQAYQKEIARLPSYEVRLRELESQGSSVIPEEQELDLVITVLNQSRQSGLHVVRNDPKPNLNTSQTNQFFQEQTMTIQISTGNDELVNFLVSLAMTNSLIRVQDLHLYPAPGQMKLDGSITLVASYQKNPPITPAASPTNALPSKAAVSPATKPGDSNRVGRSIASRLSPPQKP